MQSIQSTGTFPQHHPAEIPAGYTTAVLRVLPCNPTQLFIYWELPYAAGRCISITLSLFEASTSRESDRSPVLEIAVSPAAKSHYVTVPVPGLSCLVQLDATFTGGKHLALRPEQCTHLPAPERSPDLPVTGPVDTPPPPPPETGKSATDTALAATTGQPGIPVTSGRYSSGSLQEPFSP